MVHSIFVCSKWFCPSLSEDYIFILGNSTDPGVDMCSVIFTVESLSLLYHLLYLDLYVLGDDDDALIS